MRIKTSYLDKKRWDIIFFHQTFHMLLDVHQETPALIFYNKKSVLQL